MSKKKFNYGRELALIMLIILHILFLTVLWFGNLTGNRDLTIAGMCGGCLSAIWYIYYRIQKELKRIREEIKEIRGEVILQALILRKMKQFEEDKK